MNKTAEILIVDDNREHIGIAASILKPCGHRIRSAVNGEIALRHLERYKIDLILLDIQMPDQDGFDVYRHIRANPEWAEIPVVFSADQRDETGIAKGFALGAQDYVIKPFQPLEFAARINAHLRLAMKFRHMKLAYDELDKFCLRVSHDLKSPVTTIRQLIELLSGIPDENGRKVIELIQCKTNQLLEMMDRLLEFSRTCEMPSEMTDVDLNELYEEVFKELVRLHPARKITLKKQMLPVVRGDAVMLRLVVLNILSNAFKFTEGKERAVITVRAVKKGDRVTVMTRDNGAGFDTKYSGKLFSVFQRLHSDEEFEGSGVGLAMIKRIITRHGGCVKIDGKIGEGAEIVFTI